ERGALIAELLGGAGEQVEEARVLADLRQSTLDHLAGGGRIALLQVRLREQRQSGCIRLRRLRGPEQLGARACGFSGPDELAGARDRRPPPRPPAPPPPPPPAPPTPARP